MKKPVSRAGSRATACATESSSPGTLAMSTARATCCASSVASHRSASASDVPGGSHSSVVQIDSAGESLKRPRGSSRASTSKKCREKK
jgi:hypothetical protein